jgi:hypothetical protein
MMRFLAEGYRALDELVPGADRNRLVRLMQNALRGSAERRKRAEAELLRALRTLI